ncbi:YdcF family protein [Sphingobacterium sp. CZ-2]|uniref:YdcF family protein n=1 Tax=Sphingobacterium sp. CZ-2 TaxID=2557994 RepID=UPI00106FF4F3|nr:YdcF family protein [Sphingobacterium sp. CZ-2]QBR13283.1 YdcF family protein [Sphingobacterium sp. CZ-2]
MKKIAISILLSIISLTTVFCHSKTIMLVLGSADPKVLDERIQIALRLYKIQSFDDIIVSGGCAAHGSSICEASRMYDQMTASGIPAEKIHKEENAKTTVQNYIFSRVLKNASGEKIMQPGDTVFVVSNHWHAISVAARLEKYDGVVARFFIEGSQQPKESDKLDYVNIFNGEMDNDKFITKGTWLTPDAVWSVKDSIYYLMGNLLYVSNPENTSYTVKKLSSDRELVKGVDLEQDLHFIDDGKQWLIWDGAKFLPMDKTSGKQRGSFAWHELLRNAPESWKHSMKTGFIQDGTLYLFSDSKLLIAKKKGKYFDVETETSADQYFKNWPFGWGKGNVNAASMDQETNEIQLYRNMEVLTLDLKQRTVKQVKPLRLKWVNY